jgi:ribonuclease BN (tRNA processing enzyme)
MPRLFAVIRTLAPASFVLCWAFLPSAAAQSCGAQGLALQVLGSGGPELQDKRASSSYLVWEDGQARVLVDAGGGSALRFGESGAQMSQLDAILFTHFHVDHSGDFAALIKSSWFEDRKRSLPVYGPEGNDFMPWWNLCPISSETSTAPFATSASCGSPARKAATNYRHTMLWEARNRRRFFAAAALPRKRCAWFTGEFRRLRGG